MPLTGTDFGPAALRRRAGRSQLKRDPLGRGEMVRTNCRSAFALLALSISCRGERDQRPLSNQSAATNVADSAVPLPPLARRPSMAPDTGPTFVVHGACPFECCQYGHWRLESNVVLRLIAVSWSCIQSG